MKSILAVMIVAMLLIALALVHARWQPAPAATAWSSGPTIEHLESLSELVCLRVHISDVLVGENDSHRGSWLIKGDALIAIDLRQANIVELVRETRRATVRLPLPRVVSARVDHERTRTWSVEKTTWIPWVGNPDLIRDEAMKQAQRVIQKAAGSDENVQAARKSAEKIIREMYRMVAWDVAAEWGATERR